MCCRLWHVIYRKKSNPVYEYSRYVTRYYELFVSKCLVWGARRRGRAVVPDDEETIMNSALCARRARDYSRTCNQWPYQAPEDVGLLCYPQHSWRTLDDSSALYLASHWKLNFCNCPQFCASVRPFYLFFFQLLEHFL